MVIMDVYNVSSWESVAALILGQYELLGETLSFYVIIISVVESLQFEACVWLLYSAVMVIGSGRKEELNWKIILNPTYT